MGNSPQCDNATLHTTTGPATLNARWTANTIILNWNAGNDATFTAPAQNDAAYSCEYDGGITLPTAPTRSGYTFGGWRVHQCSLSEYLPAETYGTGYGFINDTAHAQSPYISNSDVYGLTEDNTWAVQFSEGVIKGRALCSATSGTVRGETGTPDETERGRYCWCAGTSFGNECSVASPSWVFRYADNNSTVCARDCVQLCTMSVNSDSAFRRAIFGVTQ